MSLFKPTLIIVLIAGCIVVLSGVSLHFYGRSTFNEIAPTKANYPNVILLTIDTLAAEDTSLYGYHLNTTPHIAAFANESYVFDYAYANSNFTTPSVVSILTGKYPLTHSVYQLKSFLPKRSKGENIANVLWQNGFQTAAFVANWYAHPLHNRTFADFGYLPAPQVLGIGPAIISFFARVRNSTVPTILSGFGLIKDLNEASTSFQSTTDAAAESVFGAAASFLEVSPRRPIFLWTHILPPHDPYLPPPGFKYAFLKDKTLDSVASQRVLKEGFYSKNDQPAIDKLRLRYDEHLAYADFEVGKFLKYLKANGYFENSIIVLTSDHGESFANGYVRHSGPLLYQPLIHIPLIIHLPGQSRGSRIASPSEQVDILPTILDELGISFPKWIEGESLVPAIKQQIVSAKPKFSMNLELSSRFSPLSKGTIAVLSEGFKYIHYIGSAKDELYEISKDKSEAHNLVHSQPDRALMLKEIILNKISTSQSITTAVSHR